VRIELDPFDNLLLYAWGQGLRSPPRISRVQGSILSRLPHDRRRGRIPSVRSVPHPSFPSTSIAATKRLHRFEHPAAARRVSARRYLVRRSQLHVTHRRSASYEPIRLTAPAESQEV